MNKIREEFEKKIKNHNDSNLKIFTAGYKSRYEEIKELKAFEQIDKQRIEEGLAEIKKLKYNIEGYKSDISARVEIRRDLINKNKKLKTLLKKLYENKHEPDKLYIFWSKVRKALEETDAWFTR